MLQSRIVMVVTKSGILTTVKPPIGVLPKFIWRERIMLERLVALDKAIKRRMGTLFPILPEWTEERAELISEIKKSKTK